MPRHDSDDALRSIRRWAVEALGAPPWRIYTERRDMPASERPAAVVEAASPQLPTRARVSVPQGDVEWSQTFSVMCYPAVLDTPQESRVEAARVATLLARCVALGLVTEDDPPAELAPPFRIPMYDYEDVPVVGTAIERRGPAEPYAWLRVEDAGALRPVQDPLDHLRFTVPLDLRVSWEAPGREPLPAPPATGFGGSYTAP